jgi:hypothetical protein
MSEEVSGLWGISMRTCDDRYSDTRRLGDGGGAYLGTVDSKLVGPSKAKQKYT